MFDDSVTGAQRLRALIHRAELAGQHQRAARARQLGMHQVELAALEHLLMSDGLTPGELGHRLGLTSGGVTALAGRLIDARYVQRTQHPSDRRMRILTLTAEGRVRAAELIEPILAPTDRAIEWLAVGESDTLERALDALVLLKQHSAETTPGREAERSSELYTSATLM